MKKILSSLVGLVLLGVSAHAEEISFVTTISSPVGVFSRLDASETVSTVPILNVGTSLMGNMGTITLLGTAENGDASFTTMSFSGASTLLTQEGEGEFSPVPLWQVSNVIVGDGGRMTLKRMIVSGLTASTSTIGTKLYVGTKGPSDPDNPSGEQQVSGGTGSGTLKVDNVGSSNTLRAKGLGVKKIVRGTNTWFDASYDHAYAQATWQVPGAKVSCVEATKCANLVLRYDNP